MIGAVVAGASDLTFDLLGYAFALVVAFFVKMMLISIHPQLSHFFCALCHFFRMMSLLGCIGS